MEDVGFTKFSNLFLIGGLLVILGAVTEFIYSIFPITYLEDFKMTAWIGIVYSGVLSLG